MKAQNNLPTTTASTAPQVSNPFSWKLLACVLPSAVAWRVSRMHTIMPDRTFRNFRSCMPFVRWILCSSKTSFNGFKGSESIVTIGRVATYMPLFLIPFLFLLAGLLINNFFSDRLLASLLLLFSRLSLRYFLFLYFCSPSPPPPLKNYALEKSFPCCFFSCIRPIC